jgi:hypothetical protein
MEMVWAGGMGPAAAVRMTTVAGEAVRGCEWRNGVPTTATNTPTRVADDRHAIAILDFPFARNFGCLMMNQCIPRCGLRPDFVGVKYYIASGTRQESPKAGLQRTIVFDVSRYNPKLCGF